MCFTDKRKRNWIRKEDLVPDPVRPPGRVRYGGTSRHNSGLKRGFFYVFSKDFFFDSYIPSSSTLLQNSLSKEPSETLDASTTFNFPVSVCNSNLFPITCLLECLCCWRHPTGFLRRFLGFCFAFLKFCPWWVVIFSGEISFSFHGVFFNGPQVDPLFFSLFLFAYRMARGHEEVSTSQAGHRRGTPRETPTTSNLVVAMSVEELRSYSQIPIEISLETSDGATTTTVGEVDNVIYFTREQFVAGLHLPVPSLVKQFLHFTRAPPTLIHLNVF